jgi:hypothetical protein
MSKKLEELVHALSSTVIVLKEQNEKNQAAWESRITQLEKRIQPIRLEQDVLSCVQTSINKALDTALSGYNSPLSKLAESVVETYKGAIRDNMNVAMSEAISRGDFLQQMREAFVHRVARTLLHSSQHSYCHGWPPCRSPQHFQLTWIVANCNRLEPYPKPC